ncbi:MAG: hypothetical protein VX871_07550, partial [Pseudomonadota bacterium]|nr:hypothetical protein [Pseudomonadota bacterium]
MMAHDIAGGRVIAAMLKPCRDVGYEAAVCAEGPAFPVLAAEAAECLRQDWQEEMECADVLITGTSASADYDSNGWNAARDRGVGSVAILDASINLATRFRLSQPDWICALDDASRIELERLPSRRAQIVVTGQPHLERINRLVREQSRPSDRPVLVYFSEPVVAESGRKNDIGFEQFGVAQALLQTLTAESQLTLLIKPHPNEDTSLWHRWLASVNRPANVQVEVTGHDAVALLGAASGGAGMASMALVEAATVGLPVLALQPGRSRVPNPLIDASENIEL